MKIYKGKLVILKNASMTFILLSLIYSYFYGVNKLTLLLIAVIGIVFMTLKCIKTIKYFPHSESTCKAILVLGRIILISVILIVLTPIALIFFT